MVRSTCAKLWHHAGCILRKANQIKTFVDVEGLDLLRWEDQQKIRKYVEGVTSATASASNVESTIEISETSCASCKRCSEKIMKGTLRISNKPEGQGSKGMAWHHVNCFREIFPSLDIEKLSGWDNLPLQDKESVLAVFKKDTSATKRVQGTKEEVSQQATSRETKRRKVLSDQKTAKNSVSDGNESSCANTDPERKLEEQNKALWAIKDELKKHVTAPELREMLEANGQDSAGSEYDLREHCYCILQVIQEDRGSDCYVFRKWGRVGNDKIGGIKLEELSKSFKRLVLEKTGNSWEAWEQGDFEKQPGRFCPLDIDYGVKPVSKKKAPKNTKSNLAPQVQSLMMMLFNVETYRAAMLEFQIDMTEMPLGKLSKKNIQKGFEALTEIQNLLNNSNGHEPTVRESLIVDASNRFFTLIPSIHPHVIRGEDDFKAKVKMLEALQDIEIASRLVGFDEDNDETLDEKYMKLQCNISPLLHDSEDFQMVNNYLLTTHAPTHTDWSLELEEVFALERQGEFDKYAPYRDKLKNKMLLWHGSRLTNFVGILNQGMRIAPAEAPVTGYMFGKGVYFADLVSKSARYCYVDKKDPVGLMLLSEVALGEMYELKKATSMEKPPKGKHSTKGLGKTVPLESQFVKWRDVTVPCGKPVLSGVRASELMYNEYIVYNTAQVKMQFLLKVRFHHKR